jgi:Uma2 family endonuclease
MSTIAQAAEVPETLPADDWLPPPESLYRMSVEKYEAMVASGAFTKQDRFELINGFLVTKMSEYPPHAVASTLLCQVFWRLVPEGFHLRLDKPLKIPNRSSVPEPDLVLARGMAQDFLAGHPEPKDAPIVVEVADSSLRDDRTVMARIYGGGGVPVYWIVNLVDRQVEVHQGPSAQGYGRIEVFAEGASVPVVIEGVEVGRIAVGDILPKRNPTHEDQQ